MMNMKKMKKNRKPRTAVNRRVNSWLKLSGTMCDWWDGGYPECMLPWANDSERGCKGNPFVCKKLYMKHLASAKKPNIFAVVDFEQRERNSLVPIKH